MLGALTSLGGGGPVGGGYTGGAGGSAESSAAATFRDIKSGGIESSTGAGQRAANIAIAFPGANVSQPNKINEPRAADGPVNIALAVGGIILAMGVVLFISGKD